MDVRTVITARVAHALRRLRGTGDSWTVDAADLFFQAASYDDDQVLIEVPANEFLPQARRLDDAQTDDMLRSGFARPSASMPNWWFGVQNGEDRQLFAAARATIAALLDVYGLSQDELAESFEPRPVASFEPREKPDPAPTEGEGDPLIVAGSLGEVRLYPNGFATLDGRVWASRPVLDWAVNAEEVLAITFAAPEGATFPHVGFAEDTAEAHAVMETFMPGRETRALLGTMLALAEHYALECIVTGTIYHKELVRGLWDLQRLHDEAKPWQDTNWEYADRLHRAMTATTAYFWSQSADNAHEARDDEYTTWEAIQAWVRTSPYRNDFDFEIMPMPRMDQWLGRGPEVEIQRLY